MKHIETAHAMGNSSLTMDSAQRTLGEQCRLFRGGDTRALEAAYAEHSRRLLRLALCFGLSASAAEDALQETFLRAWRARISVPDDESRFAAWLTSILANYCRRELARSRVLTRIKSVFVPRRAEHPEPSAAEQLENSESIEILRRAIANLSAADRVIFVLARVEGLNSTQIGAALKLSPEAVRVRLYRMLKEFRHRLEEESW